MHPIITIHIVIINHFLLLIYDKLVALFLPKQFINNIPAALNVVWKVLNNSLFLIFDISVSKLYLSSIIFIFL